jgi:hypothetical protein
MWPEGFSLPRILKALFVVVFMCTLSSVSTAQIGKDDAIEILCDDILMTTEDDEVAAYMLPITLNPGDEVISEDSSVTVTVPAASWFVYVDDEPCAFFEHPVRYVLIDAATGADSIAQADWPPMINGISFWDMGSPIEVYPMVSTSTPIFGAKVPLKQPLGDYGDAPDKTVYCLPAYFEVPGRFPTFWNTDNSDLDLPGCHTLNVGEEMLGTAVSCAVSAEVNADDPADPDGVPNLVDADSDERIFVIMDGNIGKFAFMVKVINTAPNVTHMSMP